MAEVTQPIRLHIGNVSPRLAENKETLQNRIGKFGSVVSDITFHTKPLQDYYFAYITVDLSSSQFEKLKAALNGIQFMGMKLKILKASANWEEKWSKDAKRQDAIKKERETRDKVDEAKKVRIKESTTSMKVNAVNDELLVNKPSFVNPYGYQISNHTYNNMSGNTKNKPPSHPLIGSNSYGAWTTPKVSNTSNQKYSNISGGSELINGRLRKTPRTADQFRQQTMRVLINGELKEIKSYKQKLWGIEKNKTLMDLTYSFSDGKWRSGDNHVVDTHITAKKCDPCGITGTVAVNYGNDIDMENTESNIINNDLEEETQKNKSVLASILTKYDFDKPLEVEENTLGIDKEDITYDSKGRRKVAHYDYEVKGGINSDDDKDFEIEKQIDADIIIEKYVADIERPKEEVYYDEDDEGNELDLDMLGQNYTTEAIKERYDESHDIEIVKEVPGALEIVKADSEDIEMDDVSKDEEGEGVDHIAKDEDVIVEIVNDSTVGTPEVDAAEADIKESNNEDSSSEVSSSSDSASSESEDVAEKTEANINESTPANASDNSDSDSDSDSDSNSDPDSSSDSSSDSDSDDSEDIELTDDEKEESVEKAVQESNESEDEFLPTFGKSEVVINNTETLRSLFNPNEGVEENKKSGFKLALDEEDEDIDEQKEIDEKKQKELLKQIKKQQEEEFIKNQSSKYGLFWGHFDSPFLQTQSQVSKFGSGSDAIKLPGESEVIETTTENADESNYEKWFWSKRGEISRECKRRKRDVSRIFRKKSKKSTIV